MCELLICPYLFPITLLYITFFFLGFLDVLLLSKITLVVSKACLLATLGHRGYQVYFPDTRRYMTFIDVTFHEDSLFFSPPSFSPIPTVAS